MKLIDKAAVVAKIERRISEYEKCGLDNTAINAKIIALQNLLIYINTLEVKEVDDIKREWYNKGYLKGRQEAHIPARKLGLPKELKKIEQEHTPKQPEPYFYCKYGGVMPLVLIVKEITKTLLLRQKK